MKAYGFAAVVLLGAAAPALGTIVPVISYDMPNGDGQASGGGWNYWDGGYNGAGATATDGAPLSGGTGDLTDGFVAPGSFLGLENGAGTGPYVGWLWGGTQNPLITFNFAGNPTITDISIHLENTGIGGVQAPSSILINGVDTPFTAPAFGTVGFVTFTGLNLTGNSHTLQLNQQVGTWTFVSEITFSSAVPEPASWAMMIAGFGLVGASMRRRRVVAV